MTPIEKIPQPIEDQRPKVCKLRSLGSGNREQSSKNSKLPRSHSKIKQNATSTLLCREALWMFLCWLQTPKGSILACGDHIFASLSQYWLVTITQTETKTIQNIISNKNAYALNNNIKHKSISICV